MPAGRTVIIFISHGAPPFSFSNTIVTSSNEDAEISSKVKRLYNLVDLDADRSNVSAYIDEILND